MGSQPVGAICQRYLGWCSMGWPPVRSWKLLQIAMLTFGLCGLIVGFNANMRHLRTFTINIHQQWGGYRGIYTGLWEKMPCSDTHGCGKGKSTFVISVN
jgi:hypothetical protein